ncbi:winged helix-turn-helix domain-containing protein [Geodermatophilus sp. URMC 65]
MLTRTGTELGEHALPTYENFLLPALTGISRADGALGRSEVKKKVVQETRLSDDQLALTCPGGKHEGRSVALDRVGWALSSLKLMGGLDNSDRGVWSITSRGRELLAQGHEAVVAANQTARSEAWRRRKSLPEEPSVADRDSDDLAEQASESWRSSWFRS